MERLFYKKPIAILMVALAVVLVFLLCMLMVFLSQLQSLKATAAEINAILQNETLSNEEKQKQLEYRNTDKYVVQWAVEMGYIPSDVHIYLPK